MKKPDETTIISFFLDGLANSGLTEDERKQVIIVAKKHFSKYYIEQTKQKLNTVLEFFNYPFLVNRKKYIDMM